MKFAEFLVAALSLSLLSSPVHAQCPAVCACRAISRTVDCTPQAGIDFRFTVIPPDGPVNTRTLIMTGNLLTTLLSGNFSVYPDLQVLVLNDNLLTSIPAEGLDSLPQLTTLSLDGNPLTDLDDGVFSNLTSLVQLSIQRTPLTTINGSVFAGLDNLERLMLQDNQISELPADLLSLVPQLEFLSLRGNRLQSLPDGFLTPLDPAVAQVDITGNPWSCDCFLRGLGDYLSVNASILSMDSQTVCLWPRRVANQPISMVLVSEFRCYAPSVHVGPSDTTVLSNVTLSLVCDLDGAPFPEVIWTKDGETFNFTERIYTRLYSGSLQFDSLELSDSGVYQCFAANMDGSVESNNATLLVLESTCFDGVLSSHETDNDCGGEFCSPCNISERCLADQDCEGELVCLYSHSLPSMLHYISRQNPLAFTCAEPSVPHTLLEDILQSELPADIYVANVSGLDPTLSLQSSLHDLLSQQLQVPRTTISNVQVATVEKHFRPLVQIWFDLQKTQTGDQARTNLLQLIDSGALKATAKIQEESSRYRVRINL